MTLAAQLSRQWIACGIDSFLEALGPGGTLLLPLFNFDFTRGMPFVDALVQHGLLTTA